MTSALLACAMLFVLGAGCTLPNELAWLGGAESVVSADVDLTNGSVIVLHDSSANPLERLKKVPDREVTVSDWLAGEKATITWSETYDRETAESIAARTAAEHATGVGETPNIPDAVYETISLGGTLATESLAAGDRIRLPSDWPEGAVEAREGNTLIWLSRKQYDELEATRHTQLSLGAIDAGLSHVADGIQTVKDLIGTVTGDNSTVTAQPAITEIEADVEWGTYALTWNDAQVRVQTISAENQFARYTILANPENPLILAVELKPWAFSTEALGILGADLNLNGYEITKISTPRSVTITP
ncbi:MAG: hypothetical protein QG626_66 [Patescibacteria group bacterium]|nr:hypothetical protein [Patescibacteria group bacterium]